MIEEYAIIQENDKGLYFTTIGLNPKFAHYWGVKDTDKIYKVTFDIHENQSEPNWDAQEYWGWLDFDDNKYKMIWPNYKLFHCCFTYGVKAEELSGKGKSVRLKLISYEKYTKE